MNAKKIGFWRWLVHGIWQCRYISKGIVHAFRENPFLEWYAGLITMPFTGIGCLILEQYIGLIGMLAIIPSVLIVLHGFYREEIKDC